MHHSPDTDTKVLVADPFPADRMGIVEYLSDNGFSVIGAAGSVVDAKGQLDGHHANVLVAGHAPQKGFDGFALAEHATREKIGTVLYINADRPTQMEEARGFAVGIASIVSKGSDISLLVEGVRNAAHAVGTVSTATAESAFIEKAKTKGLTRREAQVLFYISNGFTNNDIAKALGISRETVKEHIQNTLRKLSLDNRTRAAVWAIKNVR